jgi:GT2 family glycosyltransferase/glycosyltransferase involved in cell wall biosynthesis
MIESVLRQSYQNWELVLVDDASANPKVRRTLESFKKRDQRIKVKYRTANGGISAATNDALKLASGDYIALVDNDDMITSDALDEMAKAILSNNYPEWLYSDECKIDRNDVSSELFAKPDWSPLFLLNYMYTGHLSLYQTDLIKTLGGFRSKFDLSQDYDLALRVSEVASNIVHVEKCLYAWRMIEGSGSQGGKPTARITNIAALQSASDRRGWDGKATALPTANRLIREISQDGQPKVSIVVPSDNALNISDTINSIVTHTTYRNFEIVIVTNSGIVSDLAVQSPDVRFVAYDKPYNFSDKCNKGAEVASGKYVVFFNDDVRVVSPDWIESLLEYLTGVGVVGPKLIYENGLIQHAGMVTGVRRLVGTAFHAYPKDTSTHFNMAQCVREVSLICGALLAMPASVFNEINGFDALHAPISHSDVDLCFKVREAGYTCVYTPHAELIHIGHMSLAVVDAHQALNKRQKKDNADIFILDRWGTFLSRDPFFTESMRDLIYLDSQEEFKLHFPQIRACAPYQPSESVVIISHDLSGSGAPKVVYDMAAALIEEGNFVTVISPSDGTFRDRLLKIGAAVIIDPLILLANENSTSIVKNFDNIIVNTALGWIIIDKLKNTDSVHWYIHETELVKNLAADNFEFERVIQSAKNIWTGSKMSSDVLELYGVKPEILPYGVHAPLKHVPDKPIRIVVFGSYEPRKGQDLAVIGFKDLPQDLRQKASLKFFGRILDTHFRMAIESIADGVKEIEFCSGLSYERYLEELDQSDIVLVSSRDDTLPLVSLDALAAGKVLICGESTGTSDYLENGVSGIVYGENSPSEVSKALAKALADTKLRAKLGQGAKRLYQNTFTVSKFKQRLRENLLVQEGS